MLADRRARNGTGVLSNPNGTRREWWVRCGADITAGSRRSVFQHRSGPVGGPPMVLSAVSEWAEEAISATPPRPEDAGMQVIASQRPVAGRPSRLSVAVSFTLGTAFVAGAAWMLFAVFGLGFLERFVPSGRATTFQLVAGALAWTFALTAPPAFGLIGLSRLVVAVERARARRPRITPAVRLARAIGDDHVVATSVRIPDGSRIVPELVVGPFGAAVVEELPPAASVMSRGVRSWEVRTGDGRVRTIENPLERATRDADRVRSWFASDETDHVVKVYAAVVGTDPRAERTASCAVIAPDQVADWLTSLAPQASLDAGRRERIVRLIRASL
jgi:hypothetical protein